MSASPLPPGEQENPNNSPCAVFMDRQNLLRISAPMMVISLLLLALGVAAAWNVQRQQVTSSEKIVDEMHSLVASYDLYITLRQVRNVLQQFLRVHDQKYLDEMSPLEYRAQESLEKVKELARTSEEKARLKTIETEVRDFFRLYHRLQTPEYSESRDEELGRLVDDELSNQVVANAEEYAKFHSQVVDRTNEASRHTTEQLRQAFLLLGVCGSAAGLVAGLVVAHRFSRSMVQLHVSVRGAADKLTEVVGPVTFSQIGGLAELQAGLEEMQQHVGTVVTRLQQREREVLRQEQLAAVGQLAAGLAHELRNPLMPMKMLVQAAIDRDDERGLHGRQLEVMEEEIGRLENSIQAFLDFARPPQLEKTTFDVRPVVEQTLELISARMEGLKIDVTDSLPSEPVWIEADRRQISQVLLNLVLNAGDELPHGGKIEVTLKCAAWQADQQANGYPAKKCVVLCVADNGSGIPTNLLPRIFAPFVSSKETGTGLGLTICKRIIEEHGGQIIAQNAARGGAEFIIRLPGAEKKSE